uniref:Uncharacterized protein n=1 Tax=Strongyloides venezuelensis TaxID=75913 RepID=A0A0K0FWL4_STRVS
MSQTYDKEMLTGRDGSVSSLINDDKEIDKLLEKKKYSFILSIINILMKTYVDDGSEIFLMRKKRWRKIGEPTLEDSDLIAKNTNAEISILGKVELTI